MIKYLDSFGYEKAIEFAPCSKEGYVNIIHYENLSKTNSNGSCRHMPITAFHELLKEGLILKEQLESIDM